MAFIIKDDVIKIRTTQEEDIPFILNAEQARENARYVGQWPYERHLSAVTDPNIFHVMLSAYIEEKDVGYAILMGIDNPNNSIELTRMVITEKGKGYGSHSLALIKKWVFETLNAHRLWLDVREHNTRAQHVYQTQGFVEEGKLRECVKVGDSYQSLIVMSILRNEYNAI